MFWHRAHHISETLLTATRSDKAVYSLVSYDDGTIGIARDGAPLDSFNWPAQDMDECMETFLRLSGLDSAAVAASQFN